MAKDKKSKSREGKGAERSQGPELPKPVGLVRLRLPPVLSTIDAEDDNMAKQIALRERGKSGDLYSCADEALSGTAVALIASLRASRDPDVASQAAYSLGMLVAAGSDELKRSVGKAGGVEALATVLAAHLDDEIVWEQACSALAILCEDTMNRRLMVYLRVGPPADLHSVASTLALAAWTFRKTANTNKQVMKLMAMAALDDVSKDELLSAKPSGMESAISTLRSSPEDPNVTYHALKGIVAFCHPYPSAEVDGYCLNLIPLVVEQMKKFATDARLQEAGCELFGLLVQVEALISVMIERGCVGAVCSAMAFNSDDTGVQRKGARAIALMSETEEMRETASAAGAPGLVVTAMQYHLGHPEVAEQGLAALANLSLHPVAREAIFRSRGYKGAVVAMKSFFDVASVQAYGLGAIGNLAASSQFIETLNQEGVVDLVGQAMRGYMSNSLVQHYACLAVANMCQDAEGLTIFTAKGLHVGVVKAMQAHGDHPGVQEQGCAALSYAAASPEPSCEVIEAGGLEVIALALRKHGHYDSVLSNGLLALAAFLDHSHREVAQQRLTAVGIAGIVCGCRSESSAVMCYAQIVCDKLAAIVCEAPPPSGQQGHAPAPLADQTGYVPAACPHALPQQPLIAQTCLAPAPSVAFDIGPAPSHPVHAPTPVMVCALMQQPGMQPALMQQPGMQPALMQQPGMQPALMQQQPLMRLPQPEYVHAHAHAPQPQPQQRSHHQHRHVHPQPPQRPQPPPVMRRPPPAPQKFSPSGILGPSLEEGLKGPQASALTSSPMPAGDFGLPKGVTRCHQGGGLPVQMQVPMQQISVPMGDVVGRPAW